MRRLFAVVLLLSACREAPRSEAEVPRAAPTPPESSQIEQSANRSPLEIAELCESASQLTAKERAICADAHVAFARTALERKEYEAARSALAFAETEGADLGVVRTLRSRIPEYSTLTAAAPSPAAPQDDRSSRIAAASSLSTTFASSILSGWEMRASAAGEDCDVLLVTFYVRMDDPMIRALHNGGLIYGRVLSGGVSSFASRNGFNGILYRDGDDETWQYGEATGREKACG